jgi:hypothetical protein
MAREPVDLRVLRVWPGLIDCVRHRGRAAAAIVTEWSLSGARWPVPARDLTDHVEALYPTNDRCSIASTRPA